jgi:DNA-binding NarL/FixJ family response regulator
VAGVVALMDDLMFLSRIREAAKGRGLQVEAVRSAAAAVAAARSGARLVLVDLDSPRLPAMAAITELRAEPALASLAVVGFFSHVDAAKGRDALQAGCSAALPRSAFVARLDALLAEAAEGSGGGGEPRTGA